MSELRIALVAGETSGDRLGAALMREIRAVRPGTQFCGLAGPEMRAAGCEALGDAHELAVMGLIEPLRHIPRLWRLRGRLRQRFLDWPADVFIGIDAPAFNLGLAAQLHARGMRTVQYVSPQVWAWRPGRVHGIARSCDLILCLLPFEPDFYRAHAVRAQFVGHPLADQIPLQAPRASARAALGLDPDSPVVALLPGSRLGEVERLAATYIEVADRLAATAAGLTALVPMANAPARERFERALGTGARRARFRLLDGQAQTALWAADAALVTSGTATLEALLCRCPMVVAYRASSLTAWLLRALKLVRTQWFSLPNLLANEPLVEEFFQEAAEPAALTAALARLLNDATCREHLRQRFEVIHAQLRAGGAARAAQAVLQLCESGRPPERGE